MKQLLTCLFFILVFGTAHTQEDDVVVDTAVRVETVEEDEYEEKEDTVLLLNPAAFGTTPRSLDQNQIKELKGDDEFWYVDAVHKQKKGAVRNWDGSGLRQFFRVLLWVVGIAMVAFIAYHLFQSDVFRSGKKPVLLQSNAALEAAHFADADFGPQLEAALAANDLRAAIRIYFLQLLQGLHRKGMIQYGPDALNSEYRRQWHSHALAQQLNGLTAIYEYSWFGHFTPTPQQFAHWQQLFVDTTQKLRA